MKTNNDSAVIWTYLTEAQLHALARELRTLCVNPEFADCRAAIDRICEQSDALRERDARAQ